MRENLIAISAAGLEAHRALLEPFRAQADELAAQGLQYEEQDLRADPLSVSLLVTIVVSSAVTAIVGETIKKLLTSLSAHAKDDSATTVVNLTINNTSFVLPADRVRALGEIDALASR